MLLIATVTAHSKKPKPAPCPGGRFVVLDGPLVSGAPPGQVDAVIVGPTSEPKPTVELSLGCEPGTQKVRAMRSGTKVTATFKTCPGLRGKVTLTATIVEDCRVLAGRLTAKKYRRRFRAPRSICGDGVIDPGM